MPTLMSLTAQNLTCRRGFRTVFEGLSFEAAAGDIIALTGANGSGKTSLLRMLAGLLEPAEGAVSAGACQWVGTEDPLKPDLTVRENLEFWAGGTVGGLGGLDLEALAEMPVRYLSRGQQRRVSLSRLFTGEAPVWLLDEPENGLDTENIGRLVAAVKAHAAQGGVTVIGTHRPELWGNARVISLPRHPGEGRDPRFDLNEFPNAASLKRVDPGLRRDDGKILGAVFRRDMRGHLRRAGRALTAPLFFIMATALFPLGLPPDPALLQGTAAGVMGMAALFAALLAADRLFDEDRRDGTLDALTAAGAPLALYVAGRLGAAWIVSALPLVAVSPLLGLILGLSVQTCLFVPIVMAPATALLLLLGSLGAALVSGARQGTVLLALAVLPLYSPVLIFMSGAIDMHRTGGNAQTPLLLLLSMLAVALPAVPLACGAMLRRLIKN